MHGVGLLGLLGLVLDAAQELGEERRLVLLPAREPRDRGERGLDTGEDVVLRPAHLRLRVDQHVDGASRPRQRAKLARALALVVAAREHAELV